MALYLIPFVGAELDESGTKQYLASYERYFARLKALKSHPATGALALARADWHYDPADFRALKYASLGELQIREQWVGDADHGSNHVEGVLKLKSHSNKHVLHLRYVDIQRYELLNQNDTVQAQRTGRASHGQLLIDEFEFLESDVVHHLLWNSQARWSIACRDVRFVWEPIAKAD